MNQQVAYRFCPRCAGPLGSRQLKPTEPARLVCQTCGFIFFLDPKVATGAVFCLDGGILLLQRAIEPSLGKWVFPGGYVDRGEALEAAAIREVKEECGLDVRLARLLGVYSTAGNPVILIAFVGEVTGGTLAIDEEGLAVRAFPRDAIPWDQLAFPTTVQVIRDYLALMPHG